MSRSKGEIVGALRQLQVQTEPKLNEHAVTRQVLAAKSGYPRWATTLGVVVYCAIIWLVLGRFGVWIFGIVTGNSAG